MMKIKATRVLAVLCSMALVMSLAACGNSAGNAEAADTNSAQPTTERDAEEATPVGSGQVSVYTASPEEHVSKLFAAFEEETGIAVKFVRLSAGEIYARVQAEANNPQASLWFGTSSETFTIAGAEGYLEEYSSPMLAEVPEQFHDPKGLWTPHCAQSISFLTNENWLEANGLQAPTSWEELLDPAYASNIAIAHPATSGMSYTWLAYMCQLMGEEEAFAYLQKLNSNIFQYAKSSNSPPRMVGMEECGLTVAYNNQGMTNRDAGYPIAISYPAEGTSYEISAMALIKNGPASEAENARKLIDWSLSVGAQEEYSSYSYTAPMNRNAQMPEGLVQLTDLNTIDLDVTWASENRERLLNRFESEIRGQENLA